MTESFSRAMKQELADDFSAVVSKAEGFLKAAAHEGEETGGAMRDQVKRSLRLAKDRLGDIEDAVVRSGKATAKAADAYVHENPWQTLGASAGIGVALGVLIGVLLYRR